VDIVGDIPCQNICLLPYLLIAIYQLFFQVAHQELLDVRHDQSMIGSHSKTKALNVWTLRAANIKETI
jgi:hypothetical protein